MSSPHSVIQDPARIAAVRELGVLNSAVHEPLDDLARVAANAVQTPVSSISLLDGERQHFVTVHGVPPTHSSVRHCPADQSICQFTVAGGEPLRIPDLREDGRFGATIDLGELQVVAYLGVPLQLRDGAVVGSLCVLDARRRDWSDTDVSVLVRLADTIAGFLALRSQVLGRVLYDKVTGVPGETLFVARCDATRAHHTDGRSAMYRIELPPSRAGDDADTRDATLRRSAQLLGEAVASTDLLGRLADGAFAVFAHELRDERDALRLAARMRCALRESQDGDRRDADTARIGIALRDAPTETAAQLLHRAEHVIRGAASHGALTEIARRVA